jgi:lipoate-protein ligase B
MPDVCHVLRLGLVEYQQAWELQNRLAEQVAAGVRPQTLLLLEHPHVFTFGRRGHAEHLLWSQDELARRGVQTLWVDRGGDVTYHGPGQLVGYPLLKLAAARAVAEPQHLPQADYTGYLRRLESALIDAVAEMGVRAQRREAMTGVWVQVGGELRKIASIGIKVDARGVTRHGFALNVAPDMSFWQGIVACGLPGEGQTSLAELLPSTSMQAAITAVKAAFGKTFGFRMVDEQPGSFEPENILQTV